MDQDSQAIKPVECDTKRLSVEESHDTVDADITIHGFNISNVTVIERGFDTTAGSDTAIVHKTTSDGSDSGVEVVETAENCSLSRMFSSNSTNSNEFCTATPGQSCDSSIISIYSNYEDAFNILARRNSSLLEDYTRRNGDITSEGGSESSSVTGNFPKKKTTSNGAKKKPETKTRNPVASRTKPPITPRPKPTDRPQPKTTKTNSTKTSTKKTTCDTPTVKKEAIKAKPKTPVVTPTDDGRWPSVNSKPAPLMAKSYRGIIFETPPTLKRNESKTLDKYGTLPRRRKEKSADSIKDFKFTRSLSRENSVNRVVKRQSSRESTPSKTLPPYPRRKPLPKIKIYHETCVQTALTISDIEKALSGAAIKLPSPQDVEKFDQEVQVDNAEEIQQFKERIRTLTEKYEKLLEEHQEQCKKLQHTEEKLEEETTEKNGLKEELKHNTERVLGILGHDNFLPDEETMSSDSLLVLESRFQKVGDVVVKQENEISELNGYCRSLQRDLEKSLSAQRTLLQQQHELEAETIELQEFMQAEKSTLNDALKEAEAEIKKLSSMITQQDDCKQLTKISEERRQENMGLQARIKSLENRFRELLVHQGSTISGAAVALSSLISRLDGLVEELITSYHISEESLEDVIFHNEAYNNSSSSSPEATPERSKSIKIKSPSPKRASSFVSAIINAIKNAAAQTPFASNKDTSRDTICTDNSDSAELLDSETEPCLMMEHVLEDVTIPDGHSHNMISSGHGMLGSARPSQSESLNNLSQTKFNRQISEQTTESLNLSMNSRISNSSLADYCPSVSLVDQVIEVDNLVTRLLKVLRIIQIENDEWVTELQDERDGFCEEIEDQKENNKIVVKQLRDWEILGTRLKTEIKELTQRIHKKDDELDYLKTDLNQHRKEIERLNQDVCELSTACSKSELELKIKEDEVTETVKNWEQTGQLPASEVIARVIAAQKEVPLLKELLTKKETQINELTKQLSDSKQVLSEGWQKALKEAKKQYDTIDNALEILQSVQSVVEQCPALAKLQRDLEESNFKSISTFQIPIVTPADYNANASLLQAVANLEIVSPINTTA